MFSSIIEEDEDDETNRSKSPSRPVRVGSPHERPTTSNEAMASAQQELRVHELLALGCCFIFPLLAAWLLHTIRSHLSRPSEGLVCNYNLSIFLLMAEIRPLSHLIKMIQARTLYLQRHVNLEVLEENRKGDKGAIEDLSTRVEELEAHIANGIAEKNTSDLTESSETITAKASSQATAEVRKAVQPELEALNRAMRRYEKRSTISAVQQEARMQELEARVKDVVVLAAAVQRHADRQPRNFVLILANWVCALVVVPVEYLYAAMKVPNRLLSSLSAMPKRYLSKLAPSKRGKEGKGSKKTAKPQAQEREKRARPQA
jgi:hypothetical protein